MVNKNNQKSPDQQERNKGWIETPGMRNIIRYAVPDAASALVLDNDPVLLIAPSGTGKSFIKDKILDAAQIPADAHVHVNCAAFPESLIESELFGHKKGAFTGSAQDHPGLLGLPDKKLLVLDEINSLPKHLQAKLLTFLDSGEYRQVGGTDTKKSQMKIIGISNSDSKIETFRSDFYYRFYVISIPPLHRRRLDILILLRDLCPDIIWTGKELLRLLSYNWPGNVRELARFARFINRQCKDIKEFMDSEHEGPLEWLSVSSSHGSSNNITFAGIPSIDPANTFMNLLVEGPGQLRDKVSRNFPNLRLTSSNYVNLKEDAKVNLFEQDIIVGCDGEPVNDDTQRFWSSEWNSFCEMFRQTCDTDSDILDNIIKGRVTRIHDPMLSYLQGLGEENLQDLPQLLKDRFELIRAIHYHFFNRSSNSHDQQHLKSHLKEIAGSTPTRILDYDPLGLFFETHTPYQFKEKWLQYQIDKDRLPAKIALKYNLNRKTVAQWLIKHKKQQV